MSKSNEAKINRGLLEEGSYHRRVPVASPWIGIGVEEELVGMEYRQVPSYSGNVPKIDGHESYQ